MVHELARAELEVDHSVLAHLPHLFQPLASHCAPEFHREGGGQVGQITGILGGVEAHAALQ
eukprot:CAMPEP_0173197754 /NCGR_PEP_ID=MMETSP1141-20130122/16330_1 /TAXON_ID=483371 /ORGANISM="non described non described, Strain CCMP2298" /LENGTH=60 /DNA_ID=CAMNT_0014122517 /DNA_START=439 /DNA_END=621 /DNA_ORIENTATION=-